jgi:hypothetical protein
MKRNKPTYISDLTTEILTNRDLLHQWAENSIDMEFLELSIEILSNIDLLDRWDCDNILNIKLAPILSGDLDYKLITGHVVYIEKGVGFPIKSSSYRKMVKLLIDKKEGYNLQKQDLLNQGYSLEVIERQERIIKMNNFLKAVEKTKNYTLNNISYYLENLIPEATKRHQKEKKELFKEKVDELYSPVVDNSKNLFPLLFINQDVYKCFIEYQKHIIDSYIDYSYLKKRLEAEKLTYYHTDNAFMKIIFEDVKSISKKKYDDYDVVGKLKSLDKSYSVQRENNFNIVFEAVLNRI